MDMKGLNFDGDAGDRQAARERGQARGERVESAGQKVQSVGLGLTLLVTIPIAGAFIFGTAGFVVGALIGVVLFAGRSSS